MSLIFRRLCTSSTGIRKCTRTLIPTSNLTGAGPWRTTRTPETFLSPNIPLNLFFKRWRAGISTREDEKDTINKYGFFRDDDEEKEPLSSDDAQVEEEGNKVFSKSLRQGTVDRKTPVGEAVVQELQNMFGMTHKEALVTVRSPKFFLVADAAVLKTIYCLKDFEIPKEQIQRSPWILLQSADDLVGKINLLTDPYLFHNHFDGLGFCYFSPFRIKQYKKIFASEADDIPDHTNRIYYIADKLQVPVDHLTEKIVKTQRVLTIKLHRINVFIELLNKYEIHREDILKDLWIFFNNVNLAEERLKEVINAGCKRPKLWMCRCPEEIFARTVKRYSGEKEALGGCSSLEEYLLKRLQCSPEELNLQLEYNESLRKVSVAKIQKIIDLLFAEGFGPDQIRYSMPILGCSPERTAARIKRLRDLGMTEYPIPILYKPQKRFENFCEFYVRERSSENVQED